MEGGGSENIFGKRKKKKKEWDRDRRELCKIKYLKVLIKIANEICKTIKCLIRPNAYLDFEEKELENSFIYANVKY